MDVSERTNGLSKYVPGFIGASSEITASASENTLKVCGSSIERIKELQEYYIEVGNDAEVTIDNCLEKIKKHENTITKLNKDSTMLQEVIKKCKTELEKRQKVITDKKAKIGQLKTNLELANKEKSELEKQFENTQTLSAKAVEDLKTQMSQLTETIDSLKVQIKSKGDEVDSITEQKEELGQQLIESEQKLGKTQQELELTQQQLKSAQDEFKEINEYIDNMRSCIQKLDDKANTAKEILKKPEQETVEIEEGLLDFDF